MNINLNLFKSFYYVAFYKSFTKAADRLLTSQPSLSYNVKKLEEEMNSKLLVRENGKITITEAGEELYESLDKIFNELRIIDTNITNNAIYDGLISISVKPLIANTILWRFIKDFTKDHPNVNIRITIRTSHEIYARLDNKTADLIIDKAPFGTYTSLVDKIDLTEIHNSFICSKSFFDKYIKKDEITFEELSKFPLALPYKTRRKRELDKITEKQGIKLNSILEASDANFIYEAIKDDRCIAYLIKETVQEKLDNNQFVEVKIKDFQSETIVSALIRKNSGNSKIEQFCEYLKKESDLFNK